VSHITPAPSPISPVGAGTEPEPTDGRSTRWADHRLARRTELVHAARRAVHRIGPDVSMDEIAAAAGTSKSIVYRYFVDKPGLQMAVGEAVVAQMHMAMEEAAHAAGTPREALRAMIDIYLEMAEASPNVYWFVTRPVSDDASVPLGHFLDAVAELVARPFARVVSTEAGVLADVWAAGAVGFVRGVGEWWLSHRAAEGAPSREELTDRVTAWLWTGPVSGLARSRPDVTSPPVAPEEPS
jgi:AcrR family transcriptional regulator